MFRMDQLGRFLIIITGVKAMTISTAQKKGIINICNKLKDDTRKSLQVMTNGEVAQTFYIEAALTFRKTHAAYILAMQAYLDLSPILHPRRRFHKSVKESLESLLEELINNENNPEVDAFLKRNYQLSYHPAIEAVISMADTKPGKALSNLLLQFTDYQEPRKKKHSRKNIQNDHTHPAAPEHVQRSQLPHTEKPKRKHEEAEDPTETPSFRKKVSTTLKKKSSEGFGIFRRPTNEKAKAVLGLTSEFEDVGLSSSTLQSSPNSPEPVRKPKENSPSNETRSPRFWRRKQHITANTRSESSMTLKRQPS